MTKYPHAKNIHYVDPDKNVSDRQTDRQADRQTDGMINRTDFIDPLGKDRGLIMFFRNLRIKFT